MANTSISQLAETGLPKLRLKALVEAGALGRLALVYLGLIMLAEAITNLSVLQAGLALHGVLLYLLLAHGSLVSKQVMRRFLFTLALVPLIRLLSLSMPLVKFPLLYWYMVVGAPLFLAAFVAARVCGLQRGMVGLNARQLLNTSQSAFQGLVGLSGLILGYLEYHILTPDPLASALRLDLIWIPALILLIFTGFLEELIFRGLMQYSALRVMGLHGLYYVAAVFTVLHIGYRSIPDLIFVFAVAVYFGWVVQRSGSLLGVTVAHGLTNISLFLIFPFLVGQPNVKTPTSPEIMAPPVRTWKATPRATFTLTPSHTSAILLSSASTLCPSQKPSETLSAPSATQACSHPAGWATRRVKAGDSAASLSTEYGISLRILLQANCLRKTDPVQTGMTILVPPIIPTVSIYLNPTVRPTQTIAPASTMPPLEPTQWPLPTATWFPPTQSPINSPPTPTNPLLATANQATPTQFIPTVVPPSPSPPVLFSTPTSPPLPNPTKEPKPTNIPTIQLILPIPAATQFPSNSTTNEGGC
jgi:membrane protease YdiL (CAAX protease family)/LysM repeat protein